MWLFEAWACHQHQNRTVPIGRTSFCSLATSRGEHLPLPFVEPRRIYQIRSGIERYNLATWAYRHGDTSVSKLCWEVNLSQSSHGSIWVKHVLIVLDNLRQQLSYTAPPDRGDDEIMIWLTHLSYKETTTTLLANGLRLQLHDARCIYKLLKLGVQQQYWQDEAPCTARLFLSTTINHYS